MGLKDRVVRALFLRWLRGKLKDWRTKEGGMKKVMAALDGYKLLIGVLLMVAVRVYDQLTGSNTTSFVDAILAVVGYTPASGTVDIPAVVASVVVLVGAGHKLVKAQKGTLKP